jgi:sugar lactone lactonase YvrE
LGALGVALFLCATGCGGGGGADPGEEGPTATILFPADGSVGAAGQVTVTGTAGAGAGVAAVRVNGAPASSTDGFATWRAVVPLEVGTNVLSVEVEDATGDVLSPADQVTVRAHAEFLFWMQDVAWDAGRGVFYVYDRLLADVVRVDPATGARERLSHPDSSVSLDFLRHLVYAPDRDVLYVIDEALSLRVFALDPDVGFAFLVAGPTRGSGQDFVPGGQSTYDTAGSRLLVASEGSPSGDPYGILAVDHATGNRTVLSSASVGSGPPVSAGPICVDPVAQVVYHARRHFNDLLAIDLATGNRSVLSSASVGAGPALVSPFGIEWDAAAGRLLVLAGSATPFDGSVLAVDPTTGNRSLVSGEGTGGGPELPSAPFANRGGGTSIDPATGSLLVASDLEDVVLSVDTATGQRTASLDHYAGSGPPLSRTIDLVLDPGTGRAWVAEYARKAVLAVDLATGARAEVSGPGRGGGPSIAAMEGLALEPSSESLVVADVLADVLRVDLATGDRTVLSDPSIAPDVSFGSPAGIAVDGARGVAYLASSTAVSVIDLATGAGYLLSEEAVGGGFELESVGGVAYDPGEDRILVSDQRDDDALVEVHPVTGFRTVISSAGLGLGLLPVETEHVSLGGDHVLVADSGLQAVFRVHLATGDRVVVTSPLDGRGPPMPSPIRALGHVVPGQIVVADETGMVLLVDEQSGDRVILSK